MKDLTSTITASWSAFIAFVGAMNADEWLFVIGAAGTALSILITWIYKHKEFKVKQKYYMSKAGNDENKN